ncbi:unnamed protein product [Trichogramma brassicae]|uniref:Ionotropic glutamate receptor C-terminal domain-containing protein n=1 Tax=Trichogramma brassicae TaxID=86971 RepID=A0A6H5IFX4_9HYME|nr:unnamed protein product [Trichogramma brassicae]
MICAPVVLLLALTSGIEAPSSGFGIASMPPTILTLQMMIDYAVEEKWKQLVFFDCIGNDGKSINDKTDGHEAPRNKTNPPTDRRMHAAVRATPAQLPLQKGHSSEHQVADRRHGLVQGFEDRAASHRRDPAHRRHRLESRGQPFAQDLARYERNYDYDRLRRSQSIASPESTFVQDTLSASRTVMVFYTASVFKIRVDGNSSLEKEDWNSWSPGRRFTVKERDRPNQRKDLSANITNYVFRETAQITKENNDLVRGLTSGEIDIGAAYFEADLDRNKLLSFSYPIVHFKLVAFAQGNLGIATFVFCNGRRSIYFRPPETSSNIFLQPFSPKLLLCVLGTLVLIVAVMEVINYVTLFIHWNEDQEHFGLGEATLWCLSIMCIQGSPWTPRTRAGKTVLLVSLIFSLITYNSYSGFITSILSVKTTMINNVSDFFHYDYAFGCSKSDENYIIVGIFFFLIAPKT